MSTVLPPRDLVECHLEEAFGLSWLIITVRRTVRVKKDGEVGMKEHRTRYRIERPAFGVVKLVTERPDPATGAAVAYTVTPYDCDCKDSQIRGKERRCKHWTACEEVGLLGHKT